MEALEQLRRQLRALADLQTVIRTMKALAAARITEFQRAVESLDDYDRTVAMGLRVVLKDVDLAVPRRRPADAVGVLVLGSDHGLCGRFNEQVALQLAMHAPEWIGTGAILHVVAVGARAAEAIAVHGYDVEETVAAPAATTRIVHAVRRLLAVLDTWRTDAGIEHVHLIYNRPLPAGHHHTAAVQLLPPRLRRFERPEEARWPSRTLPTYSMNRDALLSALLRQHIFVTLFRACAESLAAEHGSRLTAMHAAERNTSERAIELQAEFRRERQDAITAELLDVIAGYESQRRERSRR